MTVMVTNNISVPVKYDAHSTWHHVASSMQGPSKDAVLTLHPFPVDKTDGASIEWRSELQ